MQTHLIFAPHVDDEVIGCLSLLLTSKEKRSNVVVAYCDPEHMKGKRGNEAHKAAKEFNFSTEWRSHGEELIEFCGRAVEDLGEGVVQDENEPIVWAPDFYFDAHPSHRQVGSIVFTYCQQFSLRYGTYTTNMNTPYTQELSPVRAESTRAYLDKLYPTQKSLWKNDHRYFLFEGRAEWALDV